mgnify:CR=1 FL=1
MAASLSPLVGERLSATSYLHDELCASRMAGRVVTTSESSARPPPYPPLKGEELKLKSFQSLRLRCARVRGAHSRASKSGALVVVMAVMAP